MSRYSERERGYLEEVFDFYLEHLEECVEDSFLNQHSDIPEIKEEIDIVRVLRKKVLEDE
jgi:hypothetical protein